MTLPSGYLHGAGHPSVAGVGWGRGDVSSHQDQFDPGACRPLPHPAGEQILANDPKTQVCSFSSQELSFNTTLPKRICQSILYSKENTGGTLPSEFPHGLA